MTTRAHLTRAQRVRLFDRHRGLCHICGQKIHVGQRWEAEHVVPIWAGGSDTPDNMAPAHIDCHSGKSSGEAPVRAKTDRQRANHLGIPKPGKKLPGGRHSDKTITISNGVQPRRTFAQKHADLMAARWPWGKPE
jgi:5-methylcytosine-specific restriction enzyme A